MKIAFHVNGQAAYIGSDGSHELPVPSTYPLRFALRDGEVVDLFPGLSDEEAIAAQQAAENPLAERQAACIARIKQEAATRIAELDWKLARAREREAAGWATLAEVDAVLAEREAIRRSSNAAEAAVAALDDVAAVQAFTWRNEVEVVAPRRLTHKQFTDRFTSEEMQAILAATATNPALNAWWEKFRLARDINLDDLATQGGVQALEIAGLIGEGRAAAVLA